MVGFCKLLILAAALIWGFGFVVMKDTVAVIPPAWLLGIRFTATGLILTVVFLKRMRATFTREYLLFGVVLGIMLFLAFWVQTIGLVSTTPGKNAFLTASYVVLVPFIYWIVLRRRPTAYNIVAAAICIVGIGFVSLQESLTIGPGEALTILSAVFFGVHIVFVSKWSDRCDVLVLTVYQFLVAGVCGLAIGAGFETLPPSSVLGETSFLFNMGYLIIFSSCLALAFQNFALKYVPPAQAALFLSTEAVFGALFSVLLHGEVLTLRLVTGFCLILVAIVVSETFPLKEAPWHKRPKGLQKGPRMAQEAEPTQEEAPGRHGRRPR